MYPVSGGITIGKPYHGRPWLQARTLPLCKTWTKAWRQGTKRLAWTNFCRACRASLLAGGRPRYGCWRPSEASMSETGLGDVVICRCTHTQRHTHFMPKSCDPVTFGGQSKGLATQTSLASQSTTTRSSRMISSCCCPDQKCNQPAFSCCFFMTLLVLSLGGAAS